MVAIAPPRPAVDRAAAIALGLVAIAFAATVASPPWLLLAAPLVLGTPHVAADVRYLIVRGPLSPPLVVAIAVPLAAMLGARVTAILGGPFDARLEIALGFTAMAFAAHRRPIVLAAITALAIPAIFAPRAALLVLLHGHNVVAFAIWLGFTRALPAARTAIVGVVVAGIAAIALGAFDFALRAAPAAGLELGALAPVFAPGLEPIAAGRVVLIYAFAQALHYIIWLYVIPRGSAGRPLRAELGLAGLAVLAGATLAVPLVAAAAGAVPVRSTYLALVVFHAWLELAVIAHLVAARRTLR